MFFLITIFCAINNFLSSVSAFWLIPDYWTTVYRSGFVERGRSSQNFIAFPDSAHLHIGYWISSEKNYHEAYGNVYPAAEGGGGDERGGARFCGTFVDIYQNKSANICGGFRVLSNKINALPGLKPFEFGPLSVAMRSPDKAVEYLDWQIARYRTNSSDKWIFGCANILQRIAYFPHKNGGGQLKKLDFKEIEPHFMDNVQVLQRTAAFDPRDLHAEYGPTDATAAALSAAKATTSWRTTPRRTATITATTTTAKTTTLSSSAAAATTTTMTKMTEYDGNDYDNLPGAGIEWDANVGKTPGPAQKLVAGGVLSIDDNELILPKQK